MTPGEISLLVTAILGPTGIWGIKELLGRRKAREQPITVKDLPPALPTDPRVADLEKKVNALTGLIGDMATRLDCIEKERDDAERERDAALARARLAVEYTMVLRNHIYDEMPPPPPEWPSGWTH